MTKSLTEKEKLLAELRKTPIVQVACKRSGVGRASYYCWRKADEKFAGAADEAVASGQSYINDMAESQLIAAIRDQNLGAVTYWLKHHHPDYTTRVELEARHKLDGSLSPEQQALISEALRLAGLTAGKKELDGPA